MRRDSLFACNKYSDEVMRMKLEANPFPCCCQLDAIHSPQECRVEGAIRTCLSTDHNKEIYLQNGGVRGMMNTNRESGEDSIQLMIKDIPARRPATMCLLVSTGWRY